MTEELHIYWATVRCKMCNVTLKPREGDHGLRLIDIMDFVVKHMITCSKYFELTETPKIEDSKS